MKKSKVINVEIDMELYDKVKSLIGYCQYNNLILKDDLPTTDNDLINDALYFYFKRIDTITGFYNIDRKALNLEEGMKIKNRFKEILINIGMKQKELSDLVGIDGATLSTIMSNKNQPSMEYFLRIWTVLGCPPIEDVFYREKS